MTIIASKNGWCSDMLWLFVPLVPWRLFDAYRFLIRLKISRDCNRQAIGKLRKTAVFALFEGLWKVLGRCSSPVCRINEKLANRLFAGFIFVQNCSVDLMMDLIDKNQATGGCASAQFPIVLLGCCPVAYPVSGWRCLCAIWTTEQTLSNGYTLTYTYFNSGFSPSASPLSRNL